MRGNKQWMRLASAGHLIVAGREVEPGSTHSTARYSDNGHVMKQFWFGVNMM